MTKRIHIIVRGRVQGVSFRWHAQRMARAFGLTGFVRNLGLGEVEIIAEGEEDKLALLKTWAGNGPPSAYVDEIHAEYSEPDQGFHDFSIRY